MLDHLVGPEPQELEDRVVRLQDLSPEIADEDGVGGVGDDDVGGEAAANATAKRRISSQAARNHGRERIHPDTSRARLRWSSRRGACVAASFALGRQVAATGTRARRRATPRDGKPYPEQESSSPGAYRAPSRRPCATSPESGCVRPPVIALF